MLENFPKHRPALPPEFEAIYADHYKQNREGNSAASGLAQKLEAWMHRKAASDSRANSKTLEIGAGTLNHLPYEPDVQHYDIAEPFHSLFESSPLIHRVTSIYDSVFDIPDGKRYDRIVSIATFEHICDLPRVVAQAGLLLFPDGSLNIGIPSEGTVLWKLGYTLTTGLEFKRKYGLDYDVLMRHEHVNTASEIDFVLRHFFAHIDRSVFGIAPSLSLYQFFRCAGPRLELCSEYLGRESQVTA